MKGLLVTGVLVCAASALPQDVPAKAASGDQVSFKFERAGNYIPNYTLTVREDGSAVYQVSYPPEVPKYSPYAATIKAQPNTEITMKVTLAPSTVGTLFERVKSTDGFRGGCASKAKNIADTGTKTLTYGTATCVYNYTEDKTIQAITQTFMGLSCTLDAGRKIEREHKYDRLALDPETENLVKAVKNGMASGIEAIAPALQGLADDPQVLERVRARAVTLLAAASAGQ